MSKVLVKACKNGDHKRLHILLNQNRIRKLINKDVNHIYPMIVACKHAQSEIVELLIECGARIDVQDHYGFPIHYAVASRKDALAKVTLLLDNDLTQLEVPNVDDEKPLMVSLRKMPTGWEGILEPDIFWYILRLKPDVRRPCNGDLPIHIAASLGYGYCAKAILQYDFYGVSTPGRLGLPPINLVVEYQPGTRNLGECYDPNVCAKIIRKMMVKRGFYDFEPGPNPAAIVVEQDDTLNGMESLSLQENASKVKSKPEIGLDSEKGGWSKLSDITLDRIAIRFNHKQQLSLGLRFGFSSSQIGAIKIDHRDNIKDATFHLLEMWRNKNALKGESALIEELMDIFSELEEGGIMRMINLL